MKMLFGCAASPPPEDASETAPPPLAEAARTEAVPAAASASAAASPPAPEAAPSKTPELAEKLLAGAIGWSDKEQAFVVVTRYSEEGWGMTLEIKVTPNKRDQKADTLCSPNATECSDNAAVAKKAAAFLDAHKLEDTTVIESVVLEPDAGAPTAELPALGAKLVWKKDHLDLTRDKKTASLPKVDAMKEFKLTATKAAASPDGKMLIVLVAYDPGAKYGVFNQGFTAYTYPVP